MPNDQKEQARKFQAEALKAAEQAEQEKRKLAQQHFESMKIDVKPSPGKIGIPAAQVPSLQTGQRDTSLKFEKPKQAMAVRDDKHAFISRDGQIRQSGSFGIQQFPESKYTEKFKRNPEAITNLAASFAEGAGRGIRAGLLNGVQWAFDQLTIGARILQEDMQAAPAPAFGPGAFAAGKPSIVLNKEKLFGREFGKDLEKFSEDVSKKLGKIAENYMKPIQDKIPGLSNSAEYGATIASGFVSMAEALAVFWITKSPNAATALLTSLDTTGDYKGAIDSGMSHNEALAVYAKSSVGTFILERIGWSFLFGKFGSKIMSKSAITGLGVSGETSTELGQTYWQNLIAQHSYDKARKIFEGTWETIVATVPVSLVASGSNTYLDPNLDFRIARNKAIRDMQNSGMTKEAATKSFDDMLSAAVQTKKDFEKAVTRKTEGLNPEEKAAIQDVETKQSMAKGEKPAIYQEIEDKLFKLGKKADFLKEKEEAIGVKPESFDETLERQLIRDEDNNVIGKRERDETLEAFEERRQEALLKREEIMPETPRDILIDKKSKEISPFMRFIEGLDLPSATNKAQRIIKNFEQPINETQRKKKAQAEKFLELFSDVTLAMPDENVDQIFEEIVAKASAPKVEKIQKIETKPLDPETQQELGRKKEPISAAPVGIPHNVIGSNKITMREKAFIKDAFRRWAKGYKAGSKETKVALRTLKNNFAELVKRLPTSKRGKFGKTIAKLETPKGLEKAMERLLKELKIVEREAVIKDIADVFTKFKKAQKTGVGISIEEQKILDSLFEGVDFTKPNKKTVEKLETLKDYLLSLPDESFLSNSIRDRLKRLSKVPLSTMSLAQLEQFRDIIVDTLVTGELRYIIKEFNKETERIANVEIAVDSLSKEGKTGMMKVETLLQRKWLEIKKWNPIGPMTGWYWKKTGQIARNLDKKGADYHQTWFKKLYAATLDAETATQDDRQRLIELGQKVNYTKWDKIKKVATKTHILLLEGHTGPASKLMSEYFPDGNLPELDSEQSQLIDGIKEIFAEKLPLFMEIFEALENKKFPKIPVYIEPTKYYLDETISSLDLMEYQYQDVKGIKARSAIERVKNATLMPREDVLEIAMEGVEENNWYIYMEPKLRMFRSIFESHQYRATVPQHVRDYMAEYIAVHARRGKPKNYSVVLSDLRNNVTMALLTGKFTTFAVQAGAGSDAYVYILMHWGQGAADNYLYHVGIHARQIPFTNNFTRKAIASSKGLQGRHGGDYQQRALEDAMVNDEYRDVDLTIPGTFGLVRIPHTKFLGNKYARMRRAVTYTTIAPMKSLDMKMAAPVVTSMREWFKENTKMTDEEIAIEADYIMEMTAGSGNPSIRPIAFGQGGLLDIFTQLKTFAASRQDIIWGSLVKEGLIKGNLSQKARSVQGLIIMMNTIVTENVVRWGIRAAILHAFGADDKAKELIEDINLKRLLTVWMASPFLEALYLGDIVRSAIQGFAPSFAPPPMDLSERLANDLRIVLSTKNPETRQKAVMRVSESYAILNGVPTSNQIFEFIDAYLQGKEEAFDLFKSSRKLPKIKSSLPRVKSQF